MARKRTEAAPQSLNPKAILKWVLRLMPVALLLISGVYIFQRVETFLIEDPRFRLDITQDITQDPESGGPAEDQAVTPAGRLVSRDPAIRVEGVVNASAERIRGVFAEDDGRSLYLFEPAERRRRLLAVDWVHDATVARLWPDRVRVRISERRPVAFVQLVPRNGRARTALIDAEGVILPPPERGSYRLPVLRGISEKHSEENRALRVALALRMLRELEAMADQISEVDVASPEKLAIHLGVSGHPVTLILGRENFHRRVSNFLRHYPEIQRRLPAATIFDLRIDDRITAVDGLAPGGQDANRSGP